MRFIIGFVILAAALAWGAAKAAAGGSVREQRMLVAEADLFQQRKDAYVVETGNLIADLAQQAARLSAIEPGSEGHETFQSARQGFDAALATARQKLDALRAAPLQEALDLIPDVDAAINDLKAAFERLLASAP
ncbi:MAG: hypothetical protein HZB55_06375 [Deltaproteobacteria bacterium]|nr:hypothetical protein [Deltaproteobacteria bacterium]